MPRNLFYAVISALFASTPFLFAHTAFIKNDSYAQVRLEHDSMTCWLLPGELMQFPLSNQTVSLTSRELVPQVPTLQEAGLPIFCISQHSFSIENAQTPVGIFIKNSELEVSVLNGILEEGNRVIFTQFSGDGIQSTTVSP